MSDKAVTLPVGKPACLILVRELTALLFTLLPHMESNFAGQREKTFSCGGCTGLIKFRLTTVPAEPTNSGSQNSSFITGRLDLISAAELLQIFHMHQKTGHLIFDLDPGRASVIFREGALVGARYGKSNGREAIFSLLVQNRGYFRFEPALPEEFTQSPEIGDFMTILMEGLTRFDEEKNKKRAVISGQGHPGQSR